MTYMAFERGRALQRLATVKAVITCATCRRARTEYPVNGISADLNRTLAASAVGAERHTHLEAKAPTPQTQTKWGRRFVRARPFSLRDGRSST